MLDGESERLLRRGLTEYDLEYIENSYGFIERAIQNNNLDGVEVVTRDLSQLREKVNLDPTERPSGISYMAKCALGISTAPTSEHTEPNSNSEFQRMLEASGKSERPHANMLKTGTMTGLLRQVDESQFPEFCDPDQCPPDFSRHCRANTEAHFGQPCIYRTPKNR